MAKFDGIISILTIGLSFSYPVAVYFGLQVFEPRWIGMLLLTVLVLRFWRPALHFMADGSASEWITFAGLGFVALAMIAFNSETLILLYPSIVSIFMLLIFARSLRYPPTIIERFARLSEPDLSAEGVGYTRNVTKVWCLFFVFNGAVSIATLFSSREIWLLYNGLLSYLLMGLIHAGEWLVRRRARPSLVRAGPLL